VNAWSGARRKNPFQAQPLESEGAAWNIPLLESLGVRMQAVYEVKEIREADAELFEDVKAGTRSLGSALDEIQPSPAEATQPEGLATEAEEPEPVAVPAWATPMAAPPPVFKPAVTKPETVRPSPSPAVLAKAGKRILEVCGKSFAAEIRGRLTPEETVQFSKLAGAEMLKIKTLMLRGWVFDEALRDVMDELTASDRIRDLLTRAVRGGGVYRCSIANFTLVVASDQAKTALEERLGGWPSK
jgi:hypothetical protein